MTRAALLTVTAAAAIGCEVGDGSGEVLGSIFFTDCNGVDKPYRDDLHAGTPEDQAPYDMKPSFFAGEPIEDLKGKINRLLIRVQSNGKRIEVTDALVFDVRNAYEVARCVRGRMDGDVPDWDARTCFRYQDPSGRTRARFRIGTDQPVRANLTLRNTCKDRQVVGVAVSKSKDPAAWESYVDLSVFGSASVAVQSNDKVDRDFKVNFGEAITAVDFHVELEDERVVSAGPAGNTEVIPEIGGDLFGKFDFDLKRGRAAQAFP